ncbi:hypothetical protein [Streptomyces sp. NBC_00347]|uniref:hypothetical protein n=1 Tax=Streptomyces sp. NBC_00347 TaxID=2975721 RepID=UPI00225312FA|nr:hypothetical protein [Streptomyces sp. NBC_00347]MCX5130018.1 hypothetical protein [Streptomyces sp. NBC_00347]
MIQPLAQSPTYVYVMTHSGFKAGKVGIGELGKGRTEAHIKEGWTLVRSLVLPYQPLARAVERAVLRPLNEAGATGFVLAGAMPQGGHTETVSLALYPAAELWRLVAEAADRIAPTGAEFTSDGEDAPVLFRMAWGNGHYLLVGSERLPAFQVVDSPGLMLTPAVEDVLRYGSGMKASGIVTTAEGATAARDALDTWVADSALVEKPATGKWWWTKHWHSVYRPRDEPEDAPCWLPTPEERERFRANARQARAVAGDAAGGKLVRITHRDARA